MGKSANIGTSGRWNGSRKVLPCNGVDRLRRSLDVHEAQRGMA